MKKNRQAVVFRIGREHYGVDIASVQEIVRVPEITEVPDAPVFLEGVMNLRGRILPVFDLRRRLGLAATERTKSTRVLVAEYRESVIGLLVDSVAEVRKILPESVEAPPDMISAIGVEYITGVVKTEGMLTILLDLAKILSVEDMLSARTAVGAAVEV